MVRLKVAGEDLVRLGVNESLASSYDDTELRERIGELEEGKVDKVAGKGLSTNDYTDADKNEINNLADKSNMIKAVGQYRANTTTGAIEQVAGNNAYLGMADYVECLPNSFYTASLYGDNEVGNLAFRISYKDANNNFIEQKNSSNLYPVQNEYKYTFLTPSNAKYLHIWIYRADIFTTIYKLQLNSGQLVMEHLPSNAVDSFARSGVDKLTHLLSEDINVIETAGYIQANGTFANADSTNKEKYTQKFYADEYAELDYKAISNNPYAFWIVVGVWYKDGTFERVQLFNQTDSAFNSKYIFDDDVEYVRFSYRTYGEIQFSIKAFINNKLNSIKDNVLNPLGNKACYDHLFVNTPSGYMTIPHESAYHIRLSKRMGFNCIELNVAKSSDNVFFVNHLTSGKFGNYFHHADGVTDISGISASSVAWDWIEANVRYNSTIEKYRTRPTRLEEALSECRQQNIIPFITASDSNVVKIADKYMGKGNYIAYGGDRLTCPSATIYCWMSKTTKDEIIEYCKGIGRPFIYGIANPTDFTDAQLKDIVDSLHELGFWIGCSYADGDWYKYSSMGFDFNGAITSINRIQNGNLHNIDSIFGFGGYNYTNADESNGVLTFSANGTIEPNIPSTIYDVCGIDFEIVFDGEIQINHIGELMGGANIYTSDGDVPLFRSIPIINGSPKLKLNVSAGTIIKELTFKATQF